MMNLAEALDHHVRARPTHPAIIHGDRVVLYADLAPLVRRTAARLASLGAGEHAVVGVCLEDTIDHLVIMYGLARAGLAMLPMDWRWTAAEKESVARHFGARLVLVEDGAEEIDEIPTLAVDRGWHEAVARADPNAPVPSGGDLPLLLSLSSGTTGRPKGPMITHMQMLRRFWTHWINLNLNSHDRYVSATPLYFGGGRTFCMSQLFAGGTVILFPPPYEPAQLVAEVARQQATSLFLVPTLLRRLLALDDAALAPLRGLRLLLSSGSALHPEERAAIRARLCANFFEYYASTEGGGVSLLTPADQGRHRDSVGRPVFAVDVEIVDDADRPVPPGQVGLLRYRGPGVATGFHNDPEASREAFRDGWFYPGDLAEMNDEGYVFLRGRRKDVIIRGGVNIHPAEIEAVLSAHPGVREAAVIGAPSRELGEEVAAFVIPRMPVTAATLIAWCRERLAPYKAPKQVVFLDDLPRNSAGKVLKQVLTTRLAER